MKNSIKNELEIKKHNNNIIKENVIKSGTKAIVCGLLTIATSGVAGVTVGCLAAGYAIKTFFENEDRKENLNIEKKLEIEYSKMIVEEALSKSVATGPMTLFGPDFDKIYSVVVEEVCEDLICGRTEILGQKDKIFVGNKESVNIIETE